MLKLFFKKILKHWDLLFLIVLSFFTRFINLAYPSRVVFDEAHFGLYATKYLSHQYFFDIHPPLGKMLFALAGLLGKVKPGFDFSVDRDYGDFNYLALRSLTCLFGSLFIILIYFFVKEMGFSRRVAFLSGFLLLFDNALVVQSRFILMDVILVFFIFLSLYFFILSKKYSPFSFKWYLFHILCGVSLGCAISVKLTGFGALGIILIITFTELVFGKSKRELLSRTNLKILSAKLIFVFLLPLLIYFIFFVIHFYLLSEPCSSNCGDVFKQYEVIDKLKTRALQMGTLKEVTGTTMVFKFLNNPPAGNIISKFFATNKAMFLSNFDSCGAHSYQSNWSSWPFLLRPIWYFYEANDDKSSSIFFLGNPFVWWLGTLGIISYLYLMVRFFVKKFKSNIPRFFYSENAIIIFYSCLVYLISFGGVARFTMIYHYLPALTFSVILFSLLFEGIIETKVGYSPTDKILFANKKANILFIGLLILVVAGFLFFSPLTYGIPLSEKAFQLRMWLPSWSF